MMKNRLSIIKIFVASSFKNIIKEKIKEEKKSP